MSTSEQLSQTIGTAEHHPSSAGSAKFENIIDDLMQECLLLMQEKYKNEGIIIKHKKRFSKTDSNEKIRSYKFSPPDAGSYLEVKNSFFSPDGGITYIEVIIGGVVRKLIVMMQETKKQGTNPEQGYGNAVERLYKNLREAENILQDESIYPFYVVAHGCDFREGCPIRDRLTAATFGSPLNKTYVKNIDPDGKNIKRASIFIFPYELNIDLIKSTYVSILSESVDYYRAKYSF